MKRCVFCGTENDDSATECVNCHNPLPDKPDGEEDRTFSFDGNGTEEESAGAQGGDPAASGTSRVLSGGDGTGTEVRNPDYSVRDYGEAPSSDGISAGSAAEGRPSDENTAGEEEKSSAQKQDTDSGAAVTYADGARQAATDSFGGRPEGTASGYLPPRGTDRADQDFGVGRGQTYGARQMYEAAGGRTESPGREQYGSAGYGYRQPAGDASAGRSDYARVNSAVGSKTILFRSRKMVKGFLFLLMTVLFTAMIVLTFLNVTLPCSVDSSVSNAYYNLTNLDSSLEGILGSANGFGTQLLTEFAKQIVSEIVNVNGIIRQLGTSVRLCILLIFAVPNTLYAAALWIMFAQTKRKRAKFGMGGYTLARVMMILKFIVACLVLAVGLVIAVYFVVAGASSARFTSSFIQGLIMLITMIVIAIFTIMYYVQWIFTLKCVRVNVRSGVDIGRVPVYIGVISLVLAVLCALMLIPLSPDDYLGLGTGAARALYFLVSGIWILIYHHAVRRASALNG